MNGLMSARRPVVRGVVDQQGPYTCWRTVCVHMGEVPYSWVWERVGSWQARAVAPGIDILYRYWALENPMPTDTPIPGDIPNPVVALRKKC